MTTAQIKSFVKEAYSHAESKNIRRGMALEVLRYPDGKLTTGACVDARQHNETIDSEGKQVLKIEVLQREDFKSESRFKSERLAQINQYANQLIA